MSSAAPKHRQIFESVRADIESGQYAPGDRIPPDVELVERFKVSRPTVARALRDLEQCGLVSRRPGAGTFVLRHGDSEAKRATKMFGLFIPGLGATEIFEPMCGEMARVVHQHHHSLLWGSGAPRDNFDDGILESAEELCRQYVQAEVAGVFFAPFVVAENRDAINHRVVDLFRDAEIPIVLLDRDYAAYPQRSEHDFVGIDNRRAGHVITDHMLDRGAERVIFVSHPFRTYTIDARVAGYAESLRLRGKKFRADSVIYCDPTNSKLVASFMKKCKPDAIVCGNDNAAAELMQSLQTLSFDVPGDVLVSGIDDVTYAAMLGVPLTTMRQPCEAIGKAAIQVMLERIESPSMPPRDVLLRSELVERSSTSAG